MMEKAQNSLFVWQHCAHPEWGVHVILDGLLALTNGPKIIKCILDSASSQLVFRASVDLSFKKSQIGVD